MPRDLIIDAMTHISAKEKLPADLSRKLVAHLIKYRAERNWLQEVLNNFLVNVYESSNQVEDLLKTVKGSFSDEDQVFLDAYLQCTDRELPGEKPKLILVDGEKEE